MQFYRCTLVSTHISMMVADDAVRLYPPAKSYHIVSRLASIGSGPKVNVARRPHVWVRIHQRVALPFQDAASMPEFLLENPRHLSGVGIQTAIGSLYGHSRGKPLQEYGLRHGGIISLQPLDAIEQHAHDALLGAKVEQLLPVYVMEGRRRL